MKCYITTSAEETKKTGELLASELKGGPARNASRSDSGREIICLEGELGSGKTTFTQGLLKGLEVEGPYTSPTFVVMKKYKPHPALSLVRRGIKGEVYHIDAYRVESKDILNLGWEEIINDKKNVVVIEWADRIKDIIPKGCLWIRFRVAGENSRMIEVGTK